MRTHTHEDVTLTSQLEPPQWGFFFQSDVQKGWCAFGLWFCLHCAFALSVCRECHSFCEWSGSVETLERLLSAFRGVTRRWVILHKSEYARHVVWPHRKAKDTGSRGEKPAIIEMVETWWSFKHEDYSSPLGPMSKGCEGSVFPKPFDLLTNTSDDVYCSLKSHHKTFLVALHK